MLGILTVTDFRNSETWNEARFIVCTLLEFTKRWSKHLRYRRLARDVERLSVSLLDNMTQGYERKGDRSFLSRAQRSIDELESALQKVEERGAINKLESVQLTDGLDAVKQSLKNDERS